MSAVKPMTATQARGAAMAQKYYETESGRGFPIAILISLFTTLLPMLLKCFQPDPANQEEHVREYVLDRWSEEKGYDEPLMRRAKFQARRAARKQKPRVRLTEAQQEEAARIVLDDARLGTDHVPVIREALATDTDDQDD